MSLVQLINPPTLYDPVPYGYSHVAAVTAANVRLVLLAGQGGEDRTGALAPDFETQLRQAMDNLCSALDAAGAKPADVARTHVMIVDHTEDRLRLLGAEFDRSGGRPEAGLHLDPRTTPGAGCHAVRDRGDRRGPHVTVLQTES